MQTAPKKHKEKMGFLESFRYLSQSKYLGYMGLMVLSYGLSMEFTEIVWKVRLSVTCAGRLEKRRTERVPCFPYFLPIALGVAESMEVVRFQHSSLQEALLRGIMNEASGLSSHSRLVEHPVQPSQAIVKMAFPDKSDYMVFMGQYSTIVGASTFVMLLIGKEVIKFLGWEVGALMTPVFMGVLAIPFFG